MSALIQHPTIAGLAELIRGGPVGAVQAETPVGDTSGAPFRHVVRSGPDRSETGRRSSSSRECSATC